MAELERGGLSAAPLGTSDLEGSYFFFFFWVHFVLVEAVSVLPFW